MHSECILNERWMQANKILWVLLNGGRTQGPKGSAKRNSMVIETHDKQYVKEDEQFIRIALRIILTLFFVSNQEKLKNKLRVCIVMSLNMISDWMISERWTKDELVRGKCFVKVESKRSKAENRSEGTVNAPRMHGKMEK